VRHTASEPKHQSTPCGSLTLCRAPCPSNELGSAMLLRKALAHAMPLGKLGTHRVALNGWRSHNFPRPLPGPVYDVQGQQLQCVRVRHHQCPEHTRLPQQQRKHVAAPLATWKQGASGACNGLQTQGHVFCTM